MALVFTPAGVIIDEAPSASLATCERRPTARDEGDHDATS
jgi:hypothetical protein